jgi:DNA-binding NtrC family response regulator
MSPLPPPAILLIEDDAIMGESLCDRFALEGFQTDWRRDAAGALAALDQRDYALAISDIRLPDRGGDELFIGLRESRRALPPFMFITGYAALDRAVELLKLGAADYIAKPFDLDELVERVKSICALTPNEGAEGTLGASGAMQRIEQRLPRLALHASTILITGESGVGKERVARLLHALGGGEGRPFVAVNCGALTESLLEAELFGHEKGAFTGAVRQRRGVFEQAHHGTLLLDEIGEMSQSMQVRLLRALQERSIVRVGGETPIPVDLRLICATHRDLKRMVEQGQFREDLYYRIHVIQLRIPPLRERREDILWLAKRFIEECVQQQGGSRKLLHPVAEQALLDYPWPGNVRELRHCIERACILSESPVLDPDAFFDDSPETPPEGEVRRSLNDYLRDCERSFIRHALQVQNWHLGTTADFLGISRKNLWEKMKKLGIHHPSEE